MIASDVDGCDREQQRRKVMYVPRKALVALVAFAR